MGGKASAEIANLYCYTIESQYIDKLISQGKLKEAQSWLNTWRFIDDMFGFGHRSWDEIDYEMSHVDTTDVPYSSLTQTSETVFLGMRAISDPRGIHLSVEPKGKGWRWIPQRFIEFSSCHTHYTREHMFLSLLTRASTLTNSADNFFKAATEYAQGLIARGFNVSSLKKSWRKFTYSKAKDHILRVTLTARFFAWLDQQDFSKAYPEDTEVRQQETAKRTQTKTQQLLCGLRAFNAIMTHLGKPTVERDFMDNKAKELADQEMELLYDTSANKIGDLYHDPRGYYCADVLHHALLTHTGLSWNQWDGREPSIDPETLAKIFLIGAGNHWTVVIKDINGHWIEKDDSRVIPIVLLHKFLSAKSKSGSVYYFGDLDTMTIRDRAKALRPQKRDRPGNSPAKPNENPADEGKSPAPQKQKNNPPPPSWLPPLHPLFLSMLPRGPPSKCKALRMTTLHRLYVPTLIMKYPPSNSIIWRTLIKPHSYQRTIQDGHLVVPPSEAKYLPLRSRTVLEHISLPRTPQTPSFHRVLIPPWACSWVSSPL